MEWELRDGRARLEAFRADSLEWTLCPRGTRRAVLQGAELDVWPVCAVTGERAWRWTVVYSTGRTPEGGVADSEERAKAIATDVARHGTRVRRVTPRGGRRVRP